MSRWVGAWAAEKMGKERWLDRHHHSQHMAQETSQQKIRPADFKSREQPVSISEKKEPAKQPLPYQDLPQDEHPAQSGSCTGKDRGPRQNPDPPAVNNDGEPRASEEDTLLPQPAGNCTKLALCVTVRHLLQSLLILPFHLPYCPGPSPS